jgi:hypothetical protein
VIAAALAALLAAAPGLAPGQARYRVEIAGARVGVAELAFTCGAGGACVLRYTSRLRLPSASGGTLRTRRVEVALDRGGRPEGAIALELDGRALTVPVAPELQGVLVPSSAAELILGTRGGGCIQVIEEETGKSGSACATVNGRRLHADVLGVREDVTLGEDGFPERIELPAQHTRFVRDARAQVPETPPPLEVRVPGPPGGRAARRFCGREPDPPSPAADLSALPPVRPDGRSCGEQAAAYAREAGRAGLPARVALGVAHDGRGFVWHAWAEVETPAGWVAVDPAFGQRPARGDRFTVARHAGDAPGMADAGSRILECWGRASVE